MLNLIKAFTGQRSCHISYKFSFSKNELLQTGLLQGAIPFPQIHQCPSWRQSQSVIGIKCLLYAHDLVLWYEIPKQNVEANTKKDLNAALDVSAKLSDTDRLQYRKKWHSSSHCLIRLLTFESNGQI